MTRELYIDRVLALYLAAPDTPRQIRRGDRTTAGQFHRQGIPLELIEHALALATLRRHLRPPKSEPLEPIRSLAYLRPLLRHLQRTGVDEDYRNYVAARYAQLKV